MPIPKAALWSNPIIENYRGKLIRLYNRIQIRVTIPEYKKFIDAKIDMDYSFRDSIVKLKILCRGDSLSLAGSKDVRIYRDHIVPTYPRVELRLTAYEYKKFIDAQLDFELSFRMAILEKNLLCSCDPFIYQNNFYGKGIKSL